MSLGVLETDVVPSEAPTKSDENWAGNSFEARKTILKTSSQAMRDADASKSRTWAIVNPEKQHYASRLPVGYKVASSPGLYYSFSLLIVRRILNELDLKPRHARLSG